MLMLLLLFYLPANLRISRLERSHRSFAMDMHDVARAYAHAHAADRKGVFGLSSEFEGMKARMQHLRQHPDLVGLYNIGGGAEGVGRALKEHGRDSASTVFVAHGLTPDTRALLIDGTMDAVISQNPQGAMLTCVRIFANSDTAKVSVWCSLATTASVSR